MSERLPQRELFPPAGTMGQGLDGPTPNSRVAWLQEDRRGEDGRLTSMDKGPLPTFLGLWGVMIRK